MSKFFICLVILFSSFATYARVYSGLEVFLKKYTHIVKGKRVGVVTNQTGVDANLNHIVDIFKRHPDINLTALLAPEHGVRGNIKAGDNFSNSIDKKTGLPIFTLYGGKDHRPSKKALASFDVIIYDIQDVGSRAYTFIWHMAECMSSAALNNKMVIVLDRPSLLANVVDGAVSEKQYLSFIGLYPIPRVYGMTSGELARYLNREEAINCQLYVVPMANYKRTMSWKDTKLPWVPTSPQIPSPESAITFAATGALGELGLFNIGIGYTLPFQTVANSWINAEFSANALNRMKLPGVKFRPIYYKPSFAAFSGKSLQGVQIHVTDVTKFRPASTELVMLSHFSKTYPKHFKWIPKKYKTFDKAVGTATIRQNLQKRVNPSLIIKSWQHKINDFLRKRQKYLIYK